MELKISTEADSTRIHTMVQQYNMAHMKDCGRFCYHLEEDGSILGGIVAEAVHDTVEVAYLFVASEHRGKGYGRKLLLHVEKEARRRQMKRILLNTYSFQSPDFYKKMGYTELFSIYPCFKDCAQYFFMKAL